MHGQAPDDSQHTQQKHIHVAGGIRTQNHITRMAADRRANGTAIVYFKIKIKIYANCAKFRPFSSELCLVLPCLRTVINGKFGTTFIKKHFYLIGYIQQTIYTTRLHEKGNIFI
jgi:hypothetical protein